MHSKLTIVSFNFLRFMAKFHSIKVADIYKETKDCSVITLDIPQELQTDFQFTQGQHVTLRALIDGQDVRRSYSLCSSPTEKKWRVAVKKINHGLFSSYVNEKLKKGDVLVFSYIGAVSKKIIFNDQSVTNVELKKMN